MGNGLNSLSSRSDRGIESSRNDIIITEGSTNNLIDYNLKEQDRNDLAQLYLARYSTLDDFKLEMKNTMVKCAIDMDYDQRINKMCKNKIEKIMDDFKIKDEETKEEYMNRIKKRFQIFTQDLDLIIDMIKENLDELDEMVLIVKEEYSNREVLEKKKYLQKIF